jgi:SAM-dependent methyltransferase
MTSDKKTAEAFANSWNNLPTGSVYTREQFEDWMAPLRKEDVQGKRVLELGCGNASLLTHVVDWDPAKLDGVDLGDSVVSAEENTKQYPDVTIIKDDLVMFTSSEPYDLVYCVGVLHHLQDPQKGFESVVRNTKSGGRFHCWVYAREGNTIIIYVVDPIRKVASRLPWWVTKYFLATPLVTPFYIYAKIVSLLPRWSFLENLPLYKYSLWIGKREFAFFRHVAFDQLVTPQTAYIAKETVEKWLRLYPEIDLDSTYIIMRNGNSWKFGGQKKV